MALSLLLLASAQSLPSAPDGRVPIYAYPAQAFIDAFAKLCIAAENDPAQQERAARKSGFKPGKGPGTPPAGVRLSRQSISFSIRTVGTTSRCSISGTANEAVALDRLGEAATATLKLSPHQVGTMGKGALAYPVAVWRPLRDGPNWSFASVFPETVDGRPGAAAHIVMTLVTPIESNQ